jgi:NAD(P)-dependent dehydrogenase (short-subunit alcohol dehydrogenase family)
MPRTVAGWVNVGTVLACRLHPAPWGSESFRAVSLPPSFAKRFIDVHARSLSLHIPLQINPELRLPPTAPQFPTMATKVALITASSAGLGAAVAKSLSPNYRVVLNYFSRPEKAAEVIKECEAIPSQQSPSSQPRFHSIQADISQRSEIQRLVKETVEKMGRLDVVVSNGGWTRMANFFDLEQNVNEEDWDKCFNMNVKAHLWLFHAAKPHFEANEEGGSFLTVASVAGVRPSGSSLPYSVTKAAEIHLTKGLATISGPNIRCNSVSPGLMMTEWGQKFPEAKVKAATEKGVLKSLATVEDVADQVRTIVMSKSMTGQNVVLDCGIAI